MNANRLFITGILCGSLMTGGLSIYFRTASAAETTPKVLLENTRVRVRQVQFEPGVKRGPHTHPYAHVGVILDAGTLEFIENGKSEKRTFKAGDVGWRDANVTHEVVNAGDAPMRIIEVELK